MLGPLVLEGLAGVVLVHVAWCDGRWRRIPNHDVLLLALLGILAASVNASPFGLTLAHAMAGAAVGLLALLPFYLLHWMGAGDVKLAAALGMCLGMAHAAEAWLISVPLVLAWGGLQYAQLGGRPPMASRVGQRAPPLRTVPYGVVLCMATVAVWWRCS